MRVYFFLTLRADNLPESGKRQYQNKGTCAPTRRNGVKSENDTTKKKLAAIFSAKRNGSAVSDAVQHRKPGSNCLSRRDTDGIARRGGIELGAMRAAAIA
jgi:hypothetical protein